MSRGAWSSESIESQRVRHNCRVLVCRHTALNCEHCHVHTLKARKVAGFYEMISYRQSYNHDDIRVRKLKSCTQALP